MNDDSQNIVTVPDISQYSISNSGPIVVGDGITYSYQSAQAYDRLEEQVKELQASMDIILQQQHQILELLYKNS